MLDPPTIVHDDSILQLAYSNDVFVERWVAKAAGMAQYRALRDHHLAYLRRGTGAWSTLLIEIRMPSLSIPNDAERAIIAERHNGMAPNLVAAAMAISTPGFGASIVRTILSAMTLTQRTPYPYKIFGSSDEALHWLAPRRNVPKAELLAPAVLAAWHGGLIAQLSTEREHG